MFATTALVSAIVSTVAAMPIESWPKLDSDEGKFVIRFPGPVDEKVEEVNTDIGTMARHTFTCSTGNALWQLAYIDLDAKVVANSSAILELAFQGARLNESDRVFAEAVGTRNGAPWKRFRVQPQFGPVVSSFVLIQSSRLYHLQVVSPPDKFRRVGSSQFFESFGLKQD